MFYILRTYDMLGKVLARVFSTLHIFVSSQSSYYPNSNPKKFQRPGIYGRFCLIFCTIVFGQLILHNLSHDCP